VKGREMVEEKEAKAPAKKKAAEEKEPAEEKKEAATVKEKKPKKAEVKEKPPKKAEEKPEPEKGEAAPAKSRKINKMTLAEVEAKLEEVKSTMGGLNSKYGQQLIQRKEYLKSLK